MAAGSEDPAFRAYARSALAAFHDYRGRLDDSRHLLNQVRREDVAGLVSPLPQAFHLFIIADHALRRAGDRAEGLEATRTALTAVAATGIRIWKVTTLFHGVLLCLAVGDRTGARVFLDRLAPLLNEDRPVDAAGWYAAQAWYDLAQGRPNDAVTR